MLARERALIERAINILSAAVNDQSAEPANRWAAFLETRTVRTPGIRTTVKARRVAFLNSLPKRERAAWNQRRFADTLRQHCEVKPGTANKLQALNIELREVE